MSDVSPISSVSASRVVGGPSAPGRDASSMIEAAPLRRQGDQVEVSQMAQYLNKLRQLAPREEMVEAARAQIAVGTYDTPEKLDAAFEELLKDL